MVNEDTLKKIRTAQAKLIQKENRSVSLSEVINDLLNEAV